MNNQHVDFYNSVQFGKVGESILKQYLNQELRNTHQDRHFNFEDLTQNRICQCAGLDFAIKKDAKITSIENLSSAIIDAVEIKSHLWVNLDIHKADLAFEVYTDYDAHKKGWVDKTLQSIEQDIIPFVRIFWINKDANNLWVASIRLTIKFIEFWKTEPWLSKDSAIVTLDKYPKIAAEPAHRINKTSTDGVSRWRSSWVPIKVLALQRCGIPFELFSLKSTMRDIWRKEKTHFSLRE